MWERDLYTVCVCILCCGYVCLVRHVCSVGSDVHGCVVVVFLVV